MTLLKYNIDKFKMPYILMHIQFTTAAIKHRQFASDIIIQLASANLYPRQFASGTLYN